MRTRIQKWGNSLALRIPKGCADDLLVARETLVDVSVENGALIVRPILPQAPSLEQLLAGITPENLHGEVDFGRAVGEEAW